jgi:transcription factor SFP1
MEARIFTDFECCGRKYATMHDFVSHLEESQTHNEMTREIPDYSSITHGMGERQAREAAREMQSFPNQQSLRVPTSQSGLSGFQGNGRSVLAPIQDIDALEDMEMEDTPAPPLQMSSINTGLAQGFRPSAPTTPNVNTSFNLFSQDPTVSSVNTPTLSTQQLNSTNADSSALFSSGMGGFDPSVSMFQNDAMDGYDTNFDYNLALQQEMDGMTIHDPAKRLSSKHTGLDPSQLQFASNSNNMQTDSEFQRILAQQQLAAGIPAAGVLGFPGQEEKKYRCPVIGCEKAYKNQNGLKYHKVVSSPLLDLS